MSESFGDASNPYESPLDMGARAGLDPMLRLQLSTMMFLQYFVWGVWAVTLATYLLKTLKFTDAEVGAVYGMGPIATILAPLFVGMVADRFFSAQRVLAVLHLAGAALMYYASTLSDFSVMRWVVLAYFLCYMPTVALTNSLSFHHLSNPERQFPGIRVLGTIGWIVAGLLVGFTQIEATNQPMLISAVASAALGIYCLSLPDTPPKGKGDISLVKLLGLDALGLMRRWPFAVFMVGSFLICIPLQFYYTFTNPFLNEIKMAVPAAIQTIGQVAEIFFLLVMPWFFIRLGVKKMLLVGMAAWATRYVLFAYGNSGNLQWMILLGLLLHGICFDFFFVTGFIYVDRNAPVELRSSAQGLLSLVTWGLAGWLGATAAGFVAGKSALPSGAHDWRMFWLWPAAAAAAVTVGFALTFFDSTHDKSGENA